MLRTPKRSLFTLTHKHTCKHNYTHTYKHTHTSLRSKGGGGGGGVGGAPHLALLQAVRNICTPPIVRDSCVPPIKARLYFFVIVPIVLSTRVWIHCVSPAFVFIFPRYQRRNGPLAHEFVRYG